MTLLKTAEGTSVQQCDGCGRTSVGPDDPIDTSEYHVSDPNSGSIVKHHYCPTCAHNRNADMKMLNFAWAASPIVADEPPTHRVRSARSKSATAEQSANDES